MKIEIFDKISNSKIEVEVSAKVAHFIEEEKKKRKEQIQAEREIGFLSLDELMENGFQPIAARSIEEELEIQYKEAKYLNSYEYKKFRNALRKAIVQRMDKMSNKLRVIMFLRFFKEMSIAKIAAEMKISKGATQEYLRRGTKYVKSFLERDIKKQDEIEKEKQMKKMNQDLK